MNASKTEQEILEAIIDRHFDALEFCKKNPTKNSAKIFRETTALATYIACYGINENHPKYWTYNGKLADLGLNNG